MNVRELGYFIAGVFGLSARTVLEIDRQLRDAGVRAAGATGRHARRATSDDAAALLIAVAAAPLFGSAVTSAAETFSKYSRLPYEDGGLVRHLADSPFPSLSALGMDHFFSDALVALLDALIEDEIPARADCKVKFDSPWPSAEIAIHGEKAWGGRYAALMDDADHTRWKAWCARMAREHGTGLFVTRMVSNGNLREIAAALRGSA